MTRVIAITQKKSRVITFRRKMINEKWVPISLFIYLLNYSKNIGYYLSKKKSNYFEYNIYIYINYIG